MTPLSAPPLRAPPLDILSATVPLHSSLSSYHFNPTEMGNSMYVICSLLSYLPSSTFLPTFLLLPLIPGFDCQSKCLLLVAGPYLYS